ncbi:phosphotriesterase-related protein [Bacillus cereus]|uniref:phosphotriesterase family protein n=1 Tax=Bacillus cereus TaxID=1396 RepID=UPI00062D1471|nr:phosphotriesterase-related protein [Bacillus cereus]KLA35449.1 hypothetical protein B4080_3362 [Bacillus cereus]MBJ8153886.1 phosphotriesterase-related protein [Bacillus cereus]MCY8952480.1 phosphotriesterase-related protein [Bacillus cereus]
MSTMVNTVLGPIESEFLGKTLIHEHFLFGFPGFSGDSTLGGLDWEVALNVAIKAVEQMKSFGVQTVVDATPNDCGRNPLFLKEVSEKTGLHIICSTGYYYEGAGASTYFNFHRSIDPQRTENEIYEMFMKEIKEGINKTGIKPGVIKVASSQDRITDYERMFFRAAARVQNETGTRIITHTQGGTMGPEQAELLISEGASPNGILIGHMCRSTDMDYHIRTLETGVYIAFDQFGLQGILGFPLDQFREKVLIELIHKGYENKIMLSHDTTIFKLGRAPDYPEKTKKLMANSYPTHIFENVIPVLKKSGVIDNQIQIMMVENPRTFFRID